MEQRFDTQDAFVERLKEVFDAESLTGRCCAYLSEIISNGKVRVKINSCARVALKNRELLQQKLLALGVESDCSPEYCQFCKVKPDSFSLAGAINLGLELTSVTASGYKALSAIVSDASERKLFKELLSEKEKQKKVLQREKKFNKYKALDNCIIGKYCIPEVVAKFWE